MSMPKLNDFELLEVIGTGSYSVVHRARQKVTLNLSVSLLRPFAIHTTIYA